MRSFKRKFLSYCLAASASWGAAAAGYSLDMGMYGDNVQRLGAQSGQATSLTGLLRLRTVFAAFAPGVTIEPSLGVLVPWRSSSDGFVKTFTSQLGFDFGIPVISWMKWRFGPGIQWNFTLARSTPVDLDNGNSTATFYVPGGSSSVLLLLAGMGLEFQVANGVTAGLETWILELANAQRRRVNAAVYLGVIL